MILGLKFTQEMRSRRGEGRDAQKMQWSVVVLSELESVTVQHGYWNAYRMTNAGRKGILFHVSRVYEHPVMGDY